MTKKEQIIAKIREECEWLLKDGCESGLPEEECIKKYDCRYCYWGNTYYPAQLSDLLWVIGSHREVFMGTSGAFYKGWNDWDKPVAKYNLQKSLLENLDNEELCDFVYELIVK